MPALQELLDLEVQFWRAAGSRDAYTANLAADAVHVFPGWGVTTDNERVLEAVEAVEPWATFSMTTPSSLTWAAKRLRWSTPLAHAVLVRVSTSPR